MTQIEVMVNVFIEMVKMMMLRYHYRRMLHNIVVDDYNLRKIISLQAFLCDK